MENREFKPARPGLVALFIGAAALFVLSFFLLLRTDINRVRVLDAQDFQVVQAEEVDLRYTIAAEDKGGAIQFSGWDYLDGVVFYDVENYVVLHDKVSGCYLRVPTMMQQTDQLEGSDSFGGFYALVKRSALEHSDAEYEVCFCVVGQELGHSYIVKTGVALQEVLQ